MNQTRKFKQVVTFINLFFLHLQGLLYNTEYMYTVQNFKYLRFKQNRNNFYWFNVSRNRHVS